MLGREYNISAFRVLDSAGQCWPAKLYFSYLDRKLVVHVTNIASDIIFLPSVLRSPFGATFFVVGEHA